ncbi:uncharacterized protein LOC106059657 [Biomphalaria glabrata]|uniref:Uncharacterized protein LOC106059657 n=1 Tax=Biomphalaria glabrata TaxID=6526 RepID=A0A9U8E5I1_BIOGL|nr:uncharacterized protein LOC106059657 [Biomphalaria glabrata]
MALLLKLFTFSWLCIYIINAMCFYKDNSTIHLSCDLDDSSTSVSWVISGPNGTITLFHCNTSTCQEVDAMGIEFSAATNLDHDHKHIVNSTLTGVLVNGSMALLRQFTKLHCETENTTVTVCNSFEQYVDPENVTCEPTLVVADILAMDCVINYVFPVASYSINIIADNVSESDNSVIENVCRFVNPSTQMFYLYILDCQIGMNITLLGSGHYQFSITASANVIEPNKLFVQSNIISMPIYDHITSVVCLKPEYDAGNSFLIVTCLAPLTVRDVVCRLNLQTNGTIFHDRFSDSRMSKLIPSENVLNTFAVKCSFDIFTTNLGIGSHQFQVDLSTRNNSDQWVFNTSDWTSPIRYYAQTQINYTVNDHSDGVTVKIGDTVTFYCSSDGFPPPARRLQLDNSPSENVTYFNGTVLSFTITNCQQAGFYSCGSFGHLGVNNYIHRSVFVNIKCPQQLYPIKGWKGNRQYVGQFLGKTELDITVIGYPAPSTMFLYKLDHPDQAIVYDKAAVVYKGGDGPYGDIGVIFKDLSLIRTETNFTLKVNNGEGDATFLDFSIQGDNGASVVRASLLALAVSIARALA